MKALKIKRFRMFMDSEKNKDFIGIFLILISIFLFTILFSTFLSGKSAGSQLPLLSSQSSTMPQLLWSNVSLISTLNNTLDALNPSIATDSKGNVHIVWAQKLPPVLLGEVFYTKLDKFGNTLVSNRQISNFNGTYAFSSSIAVDKQDNVHIVWEYDKIGRISLRGTRYTRLDPNGTIVVNGTLLPGTPLGDPQLAIDSQGNIALAWRGRDRIYYGKFDNQGNSLIPVTFFNSSFEGEPLQIKIAIDSEDTVHIVWMEELINQDAHTRYSAINSKGSIEVNNFQLDQGLNQSYNPAIAIDRNDNVFVSWDSNNASVRKIYLSKINKNGTFEIDRMPLSTNGNIAILVDPLEHLDIIWQGQGFTQLDNRGNMIINPTTIGTGGPYWSTKSIVDSQGAIHIVWSDRSLSNAVQVKYRRSLNPATITMTGVPKPGSQIQFMLQDIYNTVGNYTFGFSGGTSQGLNLSDGRKVPLNDDRFLQASLYSPQAIGLNNSTGVLDQNSQATVTFNIPSIPLGGTKLYGGFVTQDPTGRIISISDPIAFTIL